MQYNDFTKVRSVINEPYTEPVMSKLLRKTTERIDSSLLFYSVGTKIREQQSIKCPSCIIIPRTIITIEQHLAGARFHNNYIIGIAFAVKGPNDCILLQQTLYYEEALRKLFGKGDNVPILVYSDVAGHFNTIVQTVEIESPQLITEDVLVFNSGLNIVYSIWENY